jgi:radical SAM protein with 4Fe4S-binding SPASM domain
MKNNSYKHKDIYIYSDSHGTGKNPFYLLYSPMLRQAAWIRSVNFEGDTELREVADELSQFIPLKDRTNKVKRPEDYPLLTVLPNQKCNLRCSYCYSAAGRSNLESDIETLKRTIDFFIRSKKHNDKPLTISFMGGGEPVLSWKLLQESIIYAGQQAADENKRIDFTIITNGTIMKDEILDFISDNRVNISISFEIIEEIQNQQRGCYLQVVNTIYKLIQKGITPQINATITPANVHRQVEMAEIAVNKFPQIKNMMFEPVIAASLFTNVTEMTQFYADYTDNFLKALQFLREKGKSLTSFPYLRTVFPTERACMGELCLTPEGMITGCYCISSECDAGYEKSVYGEVGQARLTYDKHKFDELIADNVYAYKLCEDCSVKWNCGGGCMHHRIQYGSLFENVVCEFIRHFVQTIITDHFRFRFKQEYGIFPEETSDDDKLLCKIIDY